MTRHPFPAMLRIILVWLVTLLALLLFDRLYDQTAVLIGFLASTKR